MGLAFSFSFGWKSARPGSCPCLANTVGRPYNVLSMVQFPYPKIKRFGHHQIIADVSTHFGVLGK